MRRVIIALLFITIVPVFTFGQQDIRRRTQDQQWSTLAGAGGCIGGSTCRNKRLSVPLEDKPVLAVRFKAHDQIGQKAEGVLRVKIGADTIRDHIDVPRRGEVFTIDVDERRGRVLVFESNDDEVEISEIAVLYAREDTMRRIPRDRDDRGPGRPGRSDGWRDYPRAAGCIGGNECRKNGNRITIALEDAPVLAIRFFAHDAIGTRADGKLTVRIDEEMVAWNIDVHRNGKRHELDVESLHGSKLIIQTANDDEVDIKDIEVLYGRRERRGGGGGRGGYQPREMTHEGGCIGGDECGGRRAQIRIPLYGRPVESIRLYARDDVGTRAGGELRVRIDDEILSYAIDIPRDGKTFTIDGKQTAGDYLYLEPAENDEIVIRDVRIRFAILGDED